MILHRWLLNASAVHVGANADAFSFSRSAFVRVLLLSYLLLAVNT